ncbi:MAG: S8 family peptidase [Lachnospiraceae bacterium]|nr:S8 family peptidase [Lachnospiraceae bacterium]
MKRMNKALAWGLTSLLTTTLCNVPVNVVNAANVREEYVVVAETKKDYQNLLSEYGNAIVSSDLEEGNTMIVDLTEKEAKKLEGKNTVSHVEENILFYGSDFEDGNIEDAFGMIFESEKEAKLFLKDLRADDNETVEIEQQWNMNAINATNGEYKEGKDRIKVAVMDTGVSASDDINVAGRVNFIEGEEDVHPLYEDVSGHGTSVASIIAAQDNNIGITGINPDVELYSVKVLNDQKTASLSNVIKGIYWCMDNDIDIINMSFGTLAKSEILEEVIKEAESKGILMIAAAGNNGSENEQNVEYPAAFDEVVAVGASDTKGNISAISSVGEEIDLMAPGETIPASGFFDEIVETDGTSMAAPHVTGIASVLWAKDKSKTNRFIKKLLEYSARPMDENIAGNGLVDLEYALSVYDDFASVYTDDSEVTYDQTNEGEIPTYTDEQVKACWHYNDHASAVGAYDQTSAAALNVIKVGAKLSDTASYLKYANGSTDSFHGHYNYVANYIYVMRMARICFNSGMSAALSQAQYPCSGAGQSQIYNGIVNLNNNWSSALSGYTINNSNKARILVGIASHIAMDTYAHKAYVKGSSGKWDSHISGNTNQDSTSYVSNRWTCAKGIAYDVVNTWHYGQTPDAVEYYQPSHNKDQFRLFKFATYTSNADPTNYADTPNWYINRTSD